MHRMPGIGDGLDAEILLALGDGAALQAELLHLRDVIEKLGGTTSRRNDPSHAQLIDDPELLDWLDS